MGGMESWGLRPIINVSGAVTRLGGAPMPPEVLEAYVAAASESVPLDQVQALASRTIAEVTGAEGGLVTSGSSAALLLGTAAILAGENLARIERLPDCQGFPHDFLVAREQRNGYDHAVRAAGARLIEVGFHEPVAGSGVRRAETWEFEAACGPETAGVLYVYDRRAAPPLAELVAFAHSRGLPVLVDAAGELPPRENLRAILATGADLVAFSGGKGIRGPQGTGILCGRRDLIGSAAVQMLDLDDHFALWEPPVELIDKRRWRGFPRHGIGRSLKVSKEQILSLLAALKLFASGVYDQNLPRYRRHLESVVESLRDRPVACRLIVPADGQSLPILEIALDEAKLGRSAMEVCRRLRHGDPPVYVSHGRLDDAILVINPFHLNDERTATLCRCLRQELNP